MGHAMPWRVLASRALPLPGLFAGCLGLGVSPLNDHVGWSEWELDREVIGAGCQALPQNRQEPRQPDPPGAADAAKRATLTS